MGKTIQKLLVICGPTATGKTKLAIKLAKKFGGELISADSRQVYKYMDIGTGKDVKNMLGYDLVRPDEEFSVSNYLSFAQNTIKEIYSRKHLPILVGGTGLYIKAVIDDLDRINIPRNLRLRDKLVNKNATELFNLVMKKNPDEALKLNNSDRNNPRRLIRLLEVLETSKNYEDNAEKIKFDSVLMIGLTADEDELKKRINKRVDERIDNGFEKELNFLKKKDFFRYVPSVTLGYKDWPDIEKWKLEEYKYAKRQMTWFKKDRRIKWFDVSDEEKEVSKACSVAMEEWVQKWYSSSINATKN